MLFPFPPFPPPAPPRPAARPNQAGRVSSGIKSGQLVKAVLRPAEGAGSMRPATANSIDAFFNPALQIAAMQANQAARSNNYGSEIVFQFNPESLSFSRSMEIDTNKQGRASDTGIKKIAFAGPTALTISISNITFDTYETGADVYETYIKKLLETVKFSIFDTRIRARRPPIYYFVWKHNYLRCFVEKLDFKLTMFLADGTPVRATANLSLKGVTETGFGAVQK
ncbi:hypothetical protein ACN4EK_10030 [Pantanalinema rosaneae CENA516]|uniref:CIS tube protein n=1 Tax=Pantanalinema rosaneae TaxID=1620701 RepID=UPI003D6F0F47